MNADGCGAASRRYSGGGRRRRSGRRWSGRRRGRRRGSFATTGAGPGARACPPADLPRNSRCPPYGPPIPHPPSRPAACEAHPPAAALPRGHTPASRAHAASQSRPAHARPLSADARRPRPWPLPRHTGRARGGGLAAVGAPAREDGF